MLITSDAQFSDFLDRCKSSAYMAIDTEFLRDKTYYAKLCLLQIAIEGEVVIVDPFEIKHIERMGEVLTNPSIVKIFHACSQDMEILYHETGVVPTPVFDTQIAATLLGKTQQASYASLVSSYCHVTLQKKDSFTDWSRRPLTPSQVEYAADDVIYLPEIYHLMLEALKENNRLDWLSESFADLSREEKYVIDPRTRFLKLRRVNQLTARQMAAAREVAAWREQRAQKLNIPRKRIMADEQIVEACRREARTLDELFMVRGVRGTLGNEDARRVIRAIKEGLQCPRESLPRLSSKVKSEANVDSVVDVMNAIVRTRARENNIALQTLASQSELQLLARGHYDECELMKGWRYKIVGKELVDLLEGKIELKITDGNLEIIRTK